MPLKNTATAYGAIAKWLHWLTAALFLGAYCAVYYRHWFTGERTPENLIAFQLHLSFGVSVGVIVLLRLLWRLYSPAPSHGVLTPQALRLVKLGHLALYAMMIIVPLSGYLGTGGNTDFFFLFEIPRFEDTALYSLLVTDWMGLTFREFEAPIDFIHKQLFGQWLTWLLIAGHALAALYHHYILQDSTLRRMTTG